MRKTTHDERTLTKDLKKLATATQAEEFPRGGLKKEFERLAKKHHLSESTIRNKYYKEFKETPKPTMPAPKITNNSPIQNVRVDLKKKNSDEEYFLPKNETKPPYKRGEIIEVRVRNIAPYGVFTETTDGRNNQALIHISEVQDTYIDDLTGFFQPGDLIDARVKNVREDGKIELSTMYMDIRPKLEIKENVLENKHKNPPFNVMGEKLEALKDTIPVQEIQKPKETKPVLQKTLQKTVPATIEGLKGKMENPSTETPSVEEEFPEAAEVIRFLNGIVGAISPKGKDRLKELLEEYGVFRFTVAMMKTEEEFENDLSLQLMNEIGKKLSGGL